MAIFYTCCTLTTYDLVSHGTNASGTNQCDGVYSTTTEKGWGPAYQYACLHSGLIKTSGDISTVWYNYALASAGTIIDENTTQSNPATNDDAATESVCPKGWTLPSHRQITSIGPASGSGSDQYVSVYLPLIGGTYYNATLGAETRGAYWSSEAFDGARRYRLNYETGLLRTYGGLNRVYGMYIRCVQKS